MLRDNIAWKKKKSSSAYCTERTGDIQIACRLESPGERMVVFLRDLPCQPAGIAHGEEGPRVDPEQCNRIIESVNIGPGGIGTGTAFAVDHSRDQREETGRHDVTRQE